MYKHGLYSIVQALLVVKLGVISKKRQKHEHKLTCKYIKMSNIGRKHKTSCTLHIFLYHMLLLHLVDFL